MTAVPVRTASCPFIVSSFLSVKQGAIIPFNSQLLAPPFRQPYFIRELRFMCYINGGGASTGGASPAFQQVRIAIGHRDLTNGFIPIGLLCPTVQLATDESIVSEIEFGLFRWIMPKPMYCRAGEGIFAFAQNTFTPSAQTLQIEMSVIGDVLPPGALVPKTTSIPFASAYSTAGNTPYAASDGIAMRNPFSDKTITMQRFIGRGYQLSASKWIDADTTDANAPIVTLVDSEDRTGILPPPGVLFGEGFDARTRCLEHRRPLKPKGWFQANLSNIPANSTYWISMIGHREEAIS